MTNEALEKEWAAAILATRKAFVARVKAAVALTSPTRRNDLYQAWRKQYGDNIARESAKYAERVIAGQGTLAKLERMIGESDGQNEGGVGASAYDRAVAARKGVRR